jgi:hypothetical protein
MALSYSSDLRGVAVEQLLRNWGLLRKIIMEHAIQQLVIIV